MNSGIYQIINISNKKSYIGSAINLSARWNRHKRCLRKGTHHSARLQAAWDKNGESAFEFLVIITCASSMLIWYEQQFINRLAPEYNMCPTAGSPRGRKDSAKTLHNKSLLLKGRPSLFKGKHHSKETKDLISSKKLGIPLSQEHKAHISTSMLGHLVSPETRHKLSIIAQGRDMSIAIRTRMLKAAAKRKEKINE